MNVFAECEGCKEKFQIGTGEVVKEKYEIQHLDENEIVYITHYDCPKCKLRHYVQIDNDSTNMLLAVCTNEMRKLYGLRQRGKTNVTYIKQLKKFEQTRTDLDVARKKLMTDYTGRSARCVITGESVRLRFSV